jgi:hypothetical protein
MNIFRAWESLKKVRKLHLNKTRSSNKAGLGILSQKDMALVQWSSMGTDMTKSDRNGIFGSDEDFECYNHLWRVLGHLLGIKEKFNICGENCDETRQRIEGVKQNIFIPTFKNLPKEYESYSRNASNGVFYFYPLINHEVFNFLVKRWLGFPNYYYFESEKISKDESNGEILCKLGWYNRISLFWIIVTLEIFNKNGFLRIMSNIFALVLTILWVKFPICAILKFGYNDAIVKI